MTGIVLSCSVTATLKDTRDGQTYKTEKIGGAWWMIENMNYDISGFQYYNGEPSDSKKNGKMYNWEQSKQVCPPGWRLPSPQELIYLIKPYGKISYSGEDLKFKEIFGPYAPEKTETTYFNLVNDKRLNIPVFNYNSVEDQRTMLWTGQNAGEDRAYAIYWRIIDQYISYNSVHFSDYPIHFYGFCRCVKEE